jgi:hypothetical protein
MNLLSLNPGGPIPVTNGSPADFNGGTPVLAGALCVVDAISPVALHGLSFTPDGRLCVSTSAAPRFWLGGLPLGANGRLCCSVAQPVAFYHAGVPFDAAGRVVLANAPTSRIEHPLAALGAVLQPSPPQ